MLYNDIIYNSILYIKYNIYFKCIIFPSNKSAYSALPPVYTYFGNIPLQARKYEYDISTVGRKQFKVSKNALYFSY